MRKIVALFLVLLMLTTVPVMVYAFGTPDQGAPGTGGGDDSGTVVDQEKKEFTAPTAPADGTGEETTASAEETTEPAEETTAPPEVTTVPTEAPTVPEETVAETTTATEPEVTTAEVSQPAPVSDNQQIIESVLGQKAEQLVEPAADNSGTEGFLLIALIAGLGAICGVLVIRRILDL